jgi:serine/threonine protein kinase/tetratricopeptide (TPR) repeat protein
MGVVYEAEDIRLHRRAALKFLTGNLVSDSTALQRFEREARAASSLNHPSICTIYEVEEYEHQPVIVMELLEGKTLKERIRDGPISTEEVLDFGVQLSDALAAAHARGIIHRDLKPGNIFVVGGSRVKILDFGLAKVLPVGAEESQEESLTLNGAIPGTTPYMSPEQARGEEIDTRSDLFSLGVVLFELATGQRPFARKNRILTIDAILNARPPAPSSVNPALPSQLDAIIGKVLEKNRESRYQEASEFRNDLQQLKRITDSGKSVSGKAAYGPIYAPSNWLLALAALGAVLAVAVASYVHFRPAPKLTDKDTIVLADFTNTTGDSIFDDTLKQGLIIQLQQSPYLSLIPDDRVQRTLQFMGKPADTRLTAAVAREICERTGSAAVLEGSIARLGNEYVLGLRAKNCINGDVLDHEQVEAARKEDVLNALSRIAIKFRARAGEALTTVEKHNTPLETATTASLEALKAYSMAMQVSFSAGFAEALPHLKRAVEIDPQFAMAYASMGLFYSNIGESVLSLESTKKAYELRDHASDRERFFITTLYERNVTGNLEKEQQTLRLWGQTYPRDRDAHGLLAGFASQGTGQFEKSIEESNIALGIDPDLSPGYTNIAYANFFLDRVEEAEKTIRAAAERKRETPDLLLLQYYVAFVKNDTAGMDRAAALAKGKPGVEDWMLHSQSLVEARLGRLQAATTISRRAVDMARQAGQKESAASYEAAQAVWQALFGNAAAARRSATAALELSNGRDVEYGSAFALAVAGDLLRAQSLAADLRKRFPEDTSVQFNYLPALGAMFALNRHEPEKAIELLRANVAYESAVPPIDFYEYFGGLYPVYVRGEAYLAGHRGTEAAVEFQKIIDHRGIVAGDPIGALAHFQLGRAYAVAGDKTRAKSAYQDFLTLWKDADPDIPILQQARAEYAKL